MERIPRRIAKKSNTNISQMKRNLILTFLACGASVMLATAAQAQTPAPVPAAAPACSPACTPGFHKHHGAMMEHLSSALSLSGSQQAQIAPLLEAARPQMKAIHDKAQAQRKALIDSVSAQITPLLTPDQQTKFAQLVQNFENRSGHGARRFARHGGPVAQGDMLRKLSTALSLTTDQQTQIKPILDAAHTQIQTVRQNTSLTKDQQFAQIKTAMETAHSQINGILTPTQLAALKANFHHGQSQPAASPSTATN